METQTAPHKYTFAHRAILLTMVDETGIVSVVDSFVRICTLKAQTAEATGDPVVASEWWKLSEQLSNGALIAALSVEAKGGKVKL